MFAEPETWVAVAFLLFIALIIYLKVPAKIAAMLDDRSARIARELSEAEKLRKEAQEILADYQKKRIEAEKNAENIVAQAKIEAEALAAETRAKFAETLERRTRQAEQKIAQAEAAAIKDVRNAATEIAVAAAARIMGDTVKGAKGAQLIEDSIKAVKSQLN
jgi:F-type H+-transporting ATPase subunit b